MRDTYYDVNIESAIKSSKLYVQNSVSTYKKIVSDDVLSTINTVMASYFEHVNTTLEFIQTNLKKGLEDQKRSQKQKDLLLDFFNQNQPIVNHAVEVIEQLNTIRFGA